MRKEHYIYYRVKHWYMKVARNVLLLLFVVFISVGLVPAMYNDISSQNGDKRKIQVINDLNNRAYKCSRLKPDSGVYYGEMAVSLAEDLGDSFTVATSYGILGINYAALSNYVKALSYELRALEIYRKLGTKNSEAAMCINISQVYEKQSDLNETMKYATEAARLYDQLDQPAQKAIGLDQIGHILYRIKRNDRAFLYHKKAFDIYDEIGDEMGMARSLGNLGIIYNDSGAYEEALNHHNRAYALNEKNNNHPGMVINLVNIGNSYLNMKNHDLSLRYYQQALEGYSILKNRTGIATTTGNMGVVYYQQSQAAGLSVHTKKLLAQKAIELLNVASDTCIKLGYIEPALEFKLNLAGALMVEGSYDDATEHFMIYQRLKDSLAEADRRRETMALEMQYDVAAKEKELKIKDKELLIKDLELGWKQRTLSIILLGSALLILVLYLLWVKYSRTRRSYEKLVGEHLLQKVQIDDQILELDKNARTLHEISYIQAHNIRGPVTTVLGLCELFNQSDPSDANNSYVINNIFYVVEKLDTAVRDVIRKGEQAQQ